jgi:hypothetical protein
LAWDKVVKSKEKTVLSAVVSFVIVFNEYEIDFCIEKASVGGFRPTLST